MTPVPSEWRHPCGPPPPKLQVLPLLPHPPPRSQCQLVSPRFPKVTCPPSCQSPGSLRLFLPATLHSSRGVSTPGAFVLGSRPPSRHVSPHLSACFSDDPGPFSMWSPRSLPVESLTCSWPPSFPQSSVATPSLHQPPGAQFRPVFPSIQGLQVRAAWTLCPSSLQIPSSCTLPPVSRLRRGARFSLAVTQTLCALLLTHSPSLPFTTSHMPSFLPIPLACCPLSLSGPATLSHLPSMISLDDLSCFLG